MNNKMKLKKKKKKPKQGREEKSREDMRSGDDVPAAACCEQALSTYRS